MLAVSCCSAPQPYASACSAPPLGIGSRCHKLGIGAHVESQVLNKHTYIMSIWSTHGPMFASAIYCVLHLTMRGASAAYPPTLMITNDVACPSR